MTLRIFDSTTNKEVKDGDPIIFKLNGTSGGYKTVLLRIENDDKHHTFGEVFISAVDIDKARFKVGKTQSNMRSRIKMGDIEPYDSVPFLLTAAVSEDTPPETITSKVLKVSAVKYEV